MLAPGTDNQIILRTALPGDLNGINRLIVRAIDTWNLSERVKRVSIPLYQYHRTDLDFLQMAVATGADGGIVAIAAWEPASPREAPGNSRAVLLHGIYVDPQRQGEGIGGRLLDHVIAIAHDGAYDGLLVKAQIDACGFFAARGLEHLPVDNPLRDYPYRYWCNLRPRGTRSAA